MSITAVKLKRIRSLLWLYFWLLIFEGALRKWFLPFLANPLLLVRDPIAALAIFWSWPLITQRRFWTLLQPLLLIPPIAFILAIYVGHGDWFTALFGCRIFLIHLPLIFVFASVFNQSDIKKFALAILCVSIPMCILITLQSTSLPSHILNVGAGGVGTAAFDGAGGKYRPPGTFSFTTGVASFFTLSAASLLAVLYGNPSTPFPQPAAIITTKSNRTGILYLLASLAIVTALPVSISRALLANYMIVVLATFTVLILSRSQIVSLLYGLLGLVLIASFATTIPAVQEAAEAFSMRWEAASGGQSDDQSNVSAVQSQLQGRVLGAYTIPLSNLDHYPLWGYGIGRSTNVGAQRLSGALGFDLGEGSWERQFNELGLFIGFLFIFWRVCFVLWLLRLCLKLALIGNKFPLIFLGVSFSEILGGQLGQPTGLGFVVLSAGLTLSSCNFSPPSIGSDYNHSRKDNLI